MDTEKPRRKLTFKRTETSRLKTGAAMKPADAKPPEEAPAPPPPPPQRTAKVGITDPMAMRDTNTSKVRRVQLAKDSSPLATAVKAETQTPERKTETVQLKVVQQKKKEIADMISPASTVRLRAPVASGKTAEPEVEVPQPRRVSAAKDTLKISLPQAEPQQMAPPPAATAPAAPAATQPPQRGPDTGTRPLARVQAEPPKEPAAEPSATAVVPPPSPDTDGAKEEPQKTKQTLKLRSGGKAGKTLKLASGRGKADATVAVGGDEAGNATVRLEGEPQMDAAGVRLKPAARVALDQDADPGIAFTAGSFVTLIAMAALAYFLVMQFLTHVR